MTDAPPEKIARIREEYEFFSRYGKMMPFEEWLKHRTKKSDLPIKMIGRGRCRALSVAEMKRLTFGDRND